MEGVEKGKVRLLPHREQWEQEARQTEKQIRALWGGNVKRVCHIGSTAVPGLCAKPILDMAVQLLDMARMDIPAMEAAGYESCGSEGRDGHWLFVLRSAPGGLSLRHIHCYDANSGEFEEKVRFCRCLCENPLIAREYAQLKEKLAREHPGDREAYTRGKTDFILRILKDTETER